MIALNAAGTGWTKFDDVPNPGFTNCYWCLSCTPPLTLSSFPSECRASARAGGKVFYINGVDDGSQGLCCESDTHRYCMTLDSDKSTCCEGINPATSSITASENAVQALMSAERLAQYAYYDTNGILTIGIGFATTGVCVKPQSYNDTMCLTEAIKSLTDCVPKCARAVKRWMAQQGITCIKLPRNVLDALVVLKYNCGTLCWPKPLKDEDWTTLASTIQSGQYGSPETKKYVVQLIENKFIPLDNVGVPTGTPRCQPYFNSKCEKCGVDAWQAAKTSPMPRRIIITIPPGSGPELTRNLTMLQKTCDKCIRALKIVKGPGGCSLTDKFPKQVVQCASAGQIQAPP